MLKIKAILKSIISDSAYNRLLLHWGEIVGEGNRELLFPFEVKEGVLFIAVENPMVKSYIKNLEPMILARVHRKLPGIGIKFLKISVRPDCFPGRKKTRKGKKKTFIPPSAEEIETIRNRLVSEGIEPHHAEKMAQLEALIVQKNSSD